MLHIGTPARWRDKRDGPCAAAPHSSAICCTLEHRRESGTNATDHAQPLRILQRHAAQWNTGERAGQTRRKLGDRATPCGLQSCNVPRHDLTAASSVKGTFGRTVIEAGAGAGAGSRAVAPPAAFAAAAKGSRRFLPLMVRMIARWGCTCCCSSERAGSGAGAGAAS